MVRGVIGGLAIVTLVCGAPDAFAQASETKCMYSRKIECSRTGCQTAPVGGAYLLVPPVDYLLAATIRASSASEWPNIRRCDSAGCTPVAVRASLGGAFVNISQPDGSYFLKVSTVDVGPELQAGDFVEVASQLLGTVTYFGACRQFVK